MTASDHHLVLTDRGRNGREQWLLAAATGIQIEKATDAGGPKGSMRERRRKIPNHWTMIIPPNAQ